MRVVSVLPSATEIVCALGHDSDLVGRSAECDAPEWVRRLPVVMAPRTNDFEAASGAIDARVTAARERGESLYRIDDRSLGQLRPDVVFTQDLCGVCSVTGPELEAACRAAGISPRVVSLSPRTLEDVWDSIEVVAAALDDAEAGRRLAAELRRRTSVSRHRRPETVAVVEWLDPPIVAGLWAPDMVAAAGARPWGLGAGPAGAPGRRVSWDELARSPPDLLVLSPCSFPVDRSLRELAAPTVRAQVASVHAPRGAYVVDEAYFSRPGPRLADGVELLRHLLDDEPWEAPMPVAPWSSAGATA